MQNVFSIDGRYFNVLIPEKGIKRSFSILDSDKSGRSIAGGMVRDVIGTFYNYTITLATNRLDAKEYDDLYEIISAPDESHKIRVPYGQDYIEFDAYITGGEDVVDIIQKDGTKWSGLSLKFVAMEPYKIS